MSGRPQKGVRCPDCGRDSMRLAPGLYGVALRCEARGCEGMVSVHQGTGQVMGVPADKATRLARLRAHRVFDQLWQGERAPMSRPGAYSFLRKLLGKSATDGHIGALTETECVRLTAAALQRLEQERD